MSPCLLLRGARAGKAAVGVCRRQASAQSNTTSNQQPASIVADTSAATDCQEADLPRITPAAGGTGIIGKRLMRHWG
jgi:hypothetical protein